MSKISVLVITFAAFILGFYASEYRHQRQLGQSILRDDLGVVTTDSLVTDHSNAGTSIENVSKNKLPAITSDLLVIDPFFRVNELLAQGAYADAENLLESLKSDSTNSAQALKQLAEVYESQGKHQQAIDTWFRYIALEKDAKKMDIALNYLKQYLVKFAGSAPLNNARQDWLIARLNDGVAQIADNTDLHLALAKLYLSANERDNAQYHALMAVNQPNFRVQAEAILAHLRDDAFSPDAVLDKKSISLLRYGNQFIVEVGIDGNRAKLLLDTGASISGLTTDFVNRYPAVVRSTKPIQLNTASGTVDSYLFRVNQFDLRGLIFNNHMLAHLPMANQQEFDGLLGFDILGRFDFVIDQEKSLLLLSKRNSRTNK